MGHHREGARKWAELHISSLTNFMRLGVGLSIHLHEITKRVGGERERQGSGEREGEPPLLVPRLTNDDWAGAKTPRKHEKSPVK